MSAGVAIIVILVLVFSIGLAWHFVSEAQKAIDAGCRPLTANSWGIPSSYECPAGVDINND